MAINHFSFFRIEVRLTLRDFFVDLDLDYVHDGSTRRVWVREVLDELNRRQSPDNMPSPEMVKPSLFMRPT